MGLELPVAKYRSERRSLTGRVVAYKRRRCDVFPGPASC
jgi:hypothetical protein